jgi:hypothetical protein
MDEPTIGLSNGLYRRVAAKETNGASTDIKADGTDLLLPPISMQNQAS